jgi:hypothetical protein
MPIEINNVPRRVVYAPTGTGGEGPYAFTFEILAAGDIAVYKDDTLLTLTTHYTVTIATNGTGTVTITSAGLALAPTSPTQYAIVGDRAISRTTNYVTGGDFFANTLNDELDQQTIFAQQNAEGLARALQAPITDPANINMVLPRAADRAGKFLSFDSSGNPVPGAVPPELASVNAIAAEITAVAAIDTEITTVAGINSDVTTVAGIASDVTTVAGISADVTLAASIDSADLAAVAAILADVTTVGGIAADVIAVAAIDSDVTAVAADATDIGIVAADIADVNTVAGIAANVTTVAGISADVTAVAGDATDIGTVAGLSTEIAALGPIAADITTVAGIDSDVTAVAADATDIGAVASNIANVNTVAGISSNVTTVAGIAADVTAVAGDATDIGTVAGIAADVTTVAGISSDVTTVAADGTDIGAVAAISADVQAVANIAADVTAVAAIDSDVTTVATNVADITNFSDVYLGPAASDPATRNDSSALQAGDLYFNTVDDVMKVYDGAAWQVAYVSGGGFLAAANNLSDVSNADTSLTNLGGTTVGTGVFKAANVTAAQQALDLEVGVDVQAYDATIVVDADIGVTVQGYDADTVKYDDVNPTFTDTGAIKLPAGTEAERPGSPAAGQLRFNEDSDEFEGYDGTAWGAIGGGGVSLSSANTWTDTQTFEKPIIAPEIIYPSASFSWNSATSSPAKAYFDEPVKLIGAHRNMRRCVINDSGVVQYYLDENDSTKKADGTSATLTGGDGMVMVEIPKFYTKRVVSGTVTTWFVSDYALTGYTVHPAFVKDGVEVAKRYYSAYDACAFDVSGSTYISGLNRDNAVSNTPNVDATATTGDKLASVSGIYPMVGLTRAQFRTLAANRGAGWRQLDFALWSAVQLLYLTEYQSFYSQAILGDGNTNGSYLTQSGTQSDSPHTIAGASNGWGNYSTNGSQPSAGAKPGTAFMVYRGIENLYGNCWNWADGINVNVTTNGNVHVTNNSADFADDTSTNMTLISTTAPTTSEYVSAIAAIDNYFIASSVSGGSSSTFLTDQWFGSTSSNRVVRVGGSAGNGAGAGAFGVNANAVSSLAERSVGARLAF